MDSLINTYTGNDNIHIYSYEGEKNNTDINIHTHKYKQTHINRTKININISDTFLRLTLRETVQFMCKMHIKVNIPKKTHCEDS